MSLLRPLTRRALDHLLEARLAPCARERPVILLRWCRICAQWMRDGSAAAGRCVDCGAPRSTP